MTVAGDIAVETLVLNVAAEGLSYSVYIAGSAAYLSPYSGPAQRMPATATTVAILLAAVAPKGLSLALTYPDKGIVIRE